MRSYLLVASILLATVAGTPVADAAEARQRVVLLTSLPDADAVTKKLEYKFKKAFEPKGYETRVVHSADLSQLWNELHRSDNVGLFWLSHAGGGSGSAAGVSGGVIVDKAGFDVAAAFSAIHPNLRFLGVIGCRSKDALKIEPRPDFGSITFDRKVSASIALSKAIKASRKFIENEKTQRGYAAAACTGPAAVPVMIQRKFPTQTDKTVFPAAAIKQKGKAIAVFPAGAPGDTQVLQALLDWNDQEPLSSQFKLTLDSGAAVSVAVSSVELGRLEIQTPQDTVSRWSLFSDRSGNPIGKTSHVYRYTGGPAANIRGASTSRFDCAPMPAL